MLGQQFGTVAQVEGDLQSDIFDGLAIESTEPAQVRYVPGEKVGKIYPGEVPLTLASPDLDTLEPLQAPPARRPGGRERTAYDADLELAPRSSASGSGQNRTNRTGAAAMARDEVESRSWTGRSLQEIWKHWDAVSEAMGRQEDPGKTTTWAS